ncbi:MAG: DUF4468 domain-containing protein [Bacteroidales bacterium]|jgi:hypothetical protein|nr:DUF4468 domain-containing protein [Bacteroidales bacterium]
MRIEKKILCIMLAVMVLPVASMGQKTVYNSFPDMPVDENTKLVTYQNVVTMKGNSGELYDRAYKWANKYYKNPTAVILKHDKEKGIIECVSNIPIYTLAKDGVTKTSAGYVYYTLTIEAREGRYRYTITNIHKREQAQFPIEKWLDASRPEWTVVRYDHLHQIDEAVRKLMKDIDEGMLPPKVIVDEW